MWGWVAVAHYAAWALGANRDHELSCVEHLLGASYWTTILGKSHFNFYSSRRSPTPPPPRPVADNGLRQFKWLLRWQHSYSGLSGFQIALIILLLFCLHFGNACANEWLIIKWQLVAYLGLVQIPNILWMCSLGWSLRGGCLLCTKMQTMVVFRH